MSYACAFFFRRLPLSFYCHFLAICWLLSFAISLLICLSGWCFCLAILLTLIILAVVRLLSVSQLFEPPMRVKFENWRLSPGQMKRTGADRGREKTQRVIRKHVRPRLGRSQQHRQLHELTATPPPPPPTIALANEPDLPPNTFSNSGIGPNPAGSNKL